MPFIQGFSAYSSPRRTGVGTFRVPGTQVSLPVKREVAPILIGFSQEFHQTVEPLVRGWCWGYAWRPIIGYLRLSKHAPAIAIDLNAPRHPLGRRGTFSPRQVRQIRRLCAKYGLRWGGDWRRADEMHFEIVESRAQALARVRRLQTPVPHHPLRPPGSGGKVYSTLRLGAQGPLVKDVQDALRRDGFPTVRDGVFGPGTRARVIAFQRKHRLGSDGVVGPATWAALRRVPR